jgi:hypothetical protein
MNSRKRGTAELRVIYRCFNNAMKILLSTTAAALESREAWGVSSLAA